MILRCVPCDRSWRYPCDDCATGFVDAHLAETGHQITILEHNPSRATGYEYQAVQPSWPDWMRRQA